MDWKVISLWHVDGQGRNEDCLSELQGLNLYRSSRWCRRMEELRHRSLSVSTATDGHVWASGAGRSLPPPGTGLNHRSQLPGAAAAQGPPHGWVSQFLLLLILLLLLFLLFFFLRLLLSCLSGLVVRCLPWEQKTFPGQVIPVSSGMLP